MRGGIQVAVVIFGCGFLSPATLAAAEPPLALRVTGGVGTAVASHEGASQDGPAGMVAGDLYWRARPGRAYFLSFVSSGMIRGGARSLDLRSQREVEGSESWAALTGVEFSAPGQGVSPYFQVGIGVGGTSKSLNSRWDTLSGELLEPREHATSSALALGAFVGMRLVPRPGPLGFVIGARSHHVLSSHSNTHVISLMFGLALHPL